MKTTKTNLNPINFINAIANDQKQKDSLKLHDLLKDITNHEAKMWGPSIIGFDEYHYKYDSGREGDFMIIGFSPRKQNTSIYVINGFADYENELAKLGKHKIGKSCLYINKLKDIDTKVLKDILTKSVITMRSKYH